MSGIAGVPLAAKAEDRQALAWIERLLEDADAELLIATDQHEQATALPGAAAELLRAVVHHLARGDAVSVMPVATMLTTQEAAELLGVSRPHLVKLLERGEMPFEKAGSHRRVQLQDLLAYRRERAREQRAALDRMAQLSQDLGLYDIDLDPAELIVAEREGR